MMPQKEQYVKLIFRNGTVAEGRVEEWSDKISVLVSGNDQCRLLIMNTAEDIMLVKIDMMTKTGNDMPTISAQKHLEELNEQFEEEYDKPSTDELRLKKLADLRKLMIEEEKKVVAAKLNEHTISNTNPVGYGNPFIKSQQSTK